MSGTAAHAFPAAVEDQYAAMKAKMITPQVRGVNWYQPNNSIRLLNYFPTMEKMFEKGEELFNAEDWRQAYVMFVRLAEFIMETRKVHNSWKDPRYRKDVYRMINVLVKKSLDYAEECARQMKIEIQAQMDAQKRMRAEQAAAFEAARREEAARQAQRQAEMLREEERRARQAGEEKRAAAAAAEAAAAEAAAIVAVPVDSGGGGGGGGDGEGSGAMTAAVVLTDGGDVAGGGGASGTVPIYTGTLHTVRTVLVKGQQVSYSKAGVSLPATVVSVHHDSTPPYYVVSLPGGVTKDTTRDHLIAEGETATGAAAGAVPVPASPPPYSSVPTAPTNPASLATAVAGLSVGPPSYTATGGGVGTAGAPPPPPAAPAPPPVPQIPAGPLYGTVKAPTRGPAQPLPPVPPRTAAPPPRQRPPPAPPASSVGRWAPGVKCDINDRFVSKYTGRQMTEWRRGQIMAVNGSKVFVTFFGWPHEHDIWINLRTEPNRLASFGSKTRQVEKAWLGRTLTFREKLQQRGLRCVTMRGDGNCLFRAVAHQIWGDPERHPMVRSMVCDFMLANRGDFAEVLGALVPGPNGFARYVSNMRRPCFQGQGEWGGDPEIRVMEEIFDRPFELWDVERGGDGPANIHLEGSLPEEHCRQVSPIRVSYHGKNHYNSVQPLNERFPLGELRTSNIRRFRKAQEKPSTQNFFGK